MKTSKFFLLGKSDFIKGLILAILVAALTVIQESFKIGIFHIDWSALGNVTVTVVIAYLIKNLTTNSKGETFKKEP